MKKRENSIDKELKSDEPESKDKNLFEDELAFEDMLYGRSVRPTNSRRSSKDKKRQEKVKQDKPVSPRENPVRFRSLKKVLIILASTFLTLCLSLFIFWQWLISGAETNLTPPVLEPTQSITNSPVNTSEDEPEDNPSETTEGTLADRPTIPRNTDYLAGIEYDRKLTNILIIGTDSRDPSGSTYSRSDTMMLLTVDQENDEIKLTSFQRDMLVYLPGESRPAKLNEANLRGPDFLVQTLNQNFLLNIKDYVMVNIMDAENLIDAIGGLEIYIEDDPAVLSYLNDCIDEQNAMYEGFDNRENWVPRIEEGGLLQLNGRQTIAYARMRMLDSDYRRMERQREVLTKAYEKAKTANIFQLINLAKAGFDMVATNMSQTEMTGMAASLLPAMDADVEQLQVPMIGYFWSDDSGAWVNRANFNLMIPALHEFIYNERMTSFVPVPLVPYTPMEYVSMQYINMPRSVLNGSFKGLQYVGADGWSGDGSKVTVQNGAAVLPNVTPSASRDTTVTAAATPTPIPDQTSQSTQEESRGTSSGATVTHAATPTPVPATASPTPGSTNAATSTASPTATPRPTTAPTPRPATPTPMPTTASPSPVPTAIPTTASPTPTPVPASTPTTPPASTSEAEDGDPDDSLARVINAAA